MKSNGSMNRIYRVIWNAATGVWQAVCEIGKSHSKEKSSRSLRRAVAVAGVLIFGGALAAPASSQLPTGGNVVAGSATISTSGARMDVLQTTQRTAIDWNTFNIGSAAHVHFQQPAGGAALNRVLDTNASQIYGKLTSTGQVFLVNPNGVFFAPGAQVEVGGLVASTLSISNADFMAGRYTFSGASSNAIINQGNITARGDGAGGTIALIAAKITNEGSLTAEKGNVLLGAGSKVTLDMGGPVKLQIENDALETLIQNGGAIKADGGVVWLTSQAANNLASSVINNTGVIEAQTLATGKKGEVVLFAHDGMMSLGGTIKAEGGFVETSGKHFSITEGASVKASNWLIDPVNLIVDNTLAGAVQTALASGAVALDTSVSGACTNVAGCSFAGTDGEIHVISPISWSSVNKLTLNANNGSSKLYIYKDITASNGILELKAANKDYLQGGKVNLSAGNNFILNGATYAVITALGTSDGSTAGSLAALSLSGSMTGKYVLGADIDASATSSWNTFNGYFQGWRPIGLSATPFKGIFNGLGHNVSNLYLNRPTLAGGVGFFGATAGNSNTTSIANLTLSNVNVTGGDIVGGLIGNASTVNDGTASIYRVSVGGSVTGGSSVGGMVGRLQGGEISDSMSSVKVTGTGDAVGGIAGLMAASAYSYSRILSSFYKPVDIATSVQGNKFVGGLAGQVVGSVDGAIAIYGSYVLGGAIKGLRYVGGAVGDAEDKYRISNTWSTASATATSGSDVGGFFGRELIPTYQPTNVWWDKEASGKATDGGAAGSAVGQTTSFMKTASNYDITWSSGTSNQGNFAVADGAYPVIKTQQTPAVIVVANDGTGIASASNSGSAGFTKYIIQTGYDVSGTASYSPGTFPSSAGNTLVTPSGLTLTGADTLNNSVKYVAGKYVISAGTPVTYTFDTLSSTYTYNGDPYSLTNLWSASSLFGATYSTWGLGTDYNFKYGGNTVTSFTNAGAYNNITVDVLKSGFVPASSGNVAGSFTIAKAPLTVTANNVSTTYNSIAYAGTPGITYSGFVTPAGGSQETSAVLGGTLAYAYSTASPTNAASYTITPSGYTSNNYQFTYNTGTLSIDKKALMVTGLAASNKMFDGTTTATVTGTPALTGLIAADLANVSLTGTASGQFADASVGNNKPVSLTGLTLEGSASGNYSLTAPAGFAASIGANAQADGQSSTPTGSSNPSASPQDTAVANAQATGQSSMPTGSSNPSTSSGPGTTSSQLLSTALPTVVPTGQGTALPVVAVSGGLALVQLSPAQGQQGTQGGGSGTTNIQSVTELPLDLGGRDPLGFMRVFVVGGGLNLAPVALNTFEQAPLGSINNQ